MLKLFKIFSVSFIILFSFNFVNADDDEFNDIGETTASGCPIGATCIDNPIGDREPNVNEIIGKIIQIVLGIVGSLALGMFVYGGVVLMLSAGNQDKVQKGKDVLIWATVGIIVVFTAYAAVAFVIEGLTIGT